MRSRNSSKLLDLCKLRGIPRSRARYIYVFYMATRKGYWVLIEGVTQSDGRRTQGGVQSNLWIRYLVPGTNYKPWGVWPFCFVILSYTPRVRLRARVSFCVVFSRKTVIFSTCVLYVLPEAWPARGGLFIYFFAENVWSKVVHFFLNLQKRKIGQKINK